MTPPALPHNHGGGDSWRMAARVEAGEDKESPREQGNATDCPPRGAFAGPGVTEDETPCSGQYDPENNTSPQHRHPQHGTAVPTVRLPPRSTDVHLRLPPADQPQRFSAGPRPRRHGPGCLTGAPAAEWGLLPLLPRLRPAFNLAAATQSEFGIT